MIEIKKEIRCPELRLRWAGDECVAWCELVDKWCLKEAGCECEEYDQIIKEGYDG